MPRLVWSASIIARYAASFMAACHVDGVLVFCILFWSCIITIIFIVIIASFGKYTALKMYLKYR